MKKIFFSFILVAFGTIAANAQTIVKGDMNDDGELNVSDVTALVNAILGNSEIQYITSLDLNLVGGSDERFVKGDMNGDKIIDVSDVTIIVSTILGNAGLQFITQADFAIDTHEYVDLGLPSGTLWATCNIGAENPEDYGDYFAWGETEPQYNDVYSWHSYKYGGSVDSKIKLNKYVTKVGYSGDVDNLSELEREDDAANVNWGYNWMIPSKEQWEELVNECNIEKSIQNGISCILFTSKKNSKRMFLPAAGMRIDESLRLSAYCYWSRSLDANAPSQAYGVFAIEGYEMYCNINSNGKYRYHGNSIRPVYVSK